MSLDAAIAAEVRAVLEAELTCALAEAVEALRQTPGLDDKKTLAAKLRLSPRGIDNLRTKGMPTVMVGDLVRFDFIEVMQWLRERAVGPR